MRFDASFTRALEALNLLARRGLAGEDRADRPSLLRGASVEFADYRRYTPGDEIRYIDWNVFARHGALFVKEFSAEQNVNVSILVDASRSMGFGTPSKFDAARELAAALAYIALAGYDTVSLAGLGAGTPPPPRPHRGKSAIFPLLAELEAMELAPPGAKASLPSLPSSPGRSLVFLIADFYDASLRDAVSDLLAKRHQVQLLHVVAPEELDPPAAGRAALVDLEDGREREADLTPAAVEAYRVRLRRHFLELEDFALRRELFYVRVRSDEPLERKVRDLMKRGGIFESR